MYKQKAWTMVMIIIGIIIIISSIICFIGTKERSSEMDVKKRKRQCICNGCCKGTV